MLTAKQAMLQKALEQLEQATLDHAGWRDRLLRVISRRQPCDSKDLAAGAHRHCLFGQWYFERALPALRELPLFAMIGAEHEDQHRIAARRPVRASVTRCASSGGRLSVRCTVEMR